jgi:hypothetical protein
MVADGSDVVSGVVANGGSDVVSGVVTNRGSDVVSGVVANRAGRVICLDDLRATRLTRRRFDAPPAFTLTGFWTAYMAGLTGGTAPLCVPGVGSDIRA